MTGEYVARAESERGELVLRRRADGELELRVNGVFVMDTAETSTERVLAATTLGSLPAEARPLSVLVGGLGLGFTLDEVLRNDQVSHVVVAEIEADLVRWHLHGLIPDNAGVLDDPRVQVAVGDVRQVVADAPPSAYDLVLLDVDNGPGFLVYDDNSAVYGAAFLTSCRTTTTVGGRTAVWSSSPAPELRDVMQQVFGSCEEQAIAVTLGKRRTTYHLYVGTHLP